MEQLRWQLAPIVGEIRNKKAVVIFELYNKTDHVEYSVDGENKTKVEQIVLNGPTKVILSFNEEGTRIIRWFINEKLAYMHNILVSNNINKLIFVSCDLLEADTEISLWDRMVRELSLVRKVGVMHVGDQAYMDPIFNYYTKYIEQYKERIDNIDDPAKVDNSIMTINDDILRQMCYEAYGKRYCDTWMPHIEVLSNVSNYYIWDDHEITNDAALNKIADDTTLLINAAAVKAYNAYQQSFHLEDSFIINEYCWYKYIDVSETTVMLAIERISRVITLDEIANAIKDITAKNNKNKINRLILCFTSAPIPVPHNNYGTAYIKLKGTDKFWAPERLATLYTMLFDWLDQQEGREVVVVGGDVHFGIHGSVRKQNKIIPVIIASPITNQPHPDRSLASNGMKGEHTITDNGDIIFTTISTKARRCYGTLDLDTVPMTTNIIYNKEKYPADMYRYLKAMSKF